MPVPTLTDSGLETWLVFLRQTALPDFAAFPLLDDPGGRALLKEYYRAHLLIAEAAGAGLLLETPTWRASRGWGARLGYDAHGLDRLNQSAVMMLRSLGEEFTGVHLQVSGNIGPRGDGYSPASQLTPDEAAAYHRPQIESFRAAGADRVTMLTATHTGEAIGVIRAAADAGTPVVMSFTVETDGRLPSGQSLHDAIREVDDATDSLPLHYGINCAHPDHFTRALDADPEASARIGLIRANASRASHAELDDAEILDDGDPTELAEQYAGLLQAHSHLAVLGGCCGTDARHIAAIALACVPGY